MKDDRRERRDHHTPAIPALPQGEQLRERARGFIDTGRVMGLAKGLAGPFVPGLKERLDSTGISDLKAIVFFVRL